ncbi:hypothetical protein ACIRBX_15755 [Kitasatospora sp. NPDC096147]|uniref:hypothetical protein n=1 Tax=Kitasatospora sp. NPDC096147 TaxID=3364093 RepID=UPI00380EC409
MVLRVWLAVPVLAMAVFLLASGVATLARGWMLPLNRRYVRRPRLHGWAQVVAALALGWQVLFGLLVADFGFRSTLVGLGSVLLAAAFGMMGLSQRPGRPAR